MTTSHALHLFASSRATGAAAGEAGQVAAGAAVLALGAQAQTYPAAGKTIKLADLISNTQSIVANDPGFARIYLREKASLMDVLREGDPDLWASANHLLQEGLRTLKLA